MPAAPQARGTITPRRIVLAHLLFFASGSLALIYELLWMRRFALLFGAAAPSLAATVSAVFLGMSAGAALLGPRAALAQRPLRVFGGLEAGVGIAHLTAGRWRGLRVRA